MPWRPGRNRRRRPPQFDRPARLLGALLVTVGLTLLGASSLPGVARAALGALSFSLETYNQDGTPGGGTVDFGALVPGHQAVANPAVVFHLSSDLEWHLTAQADLAALPGSCLLEQRVAGEASWVSLSATPATLEGLQPPCGLSHIAGELRLTPGWDLPPGSYTVQVTYDCSFTDHAPPTGSVVAVNGQPTTGAIYVNTTGLTLSLSAADDSSGVDGFALADGNPGGLAWSAWQGYDPSDPTAAWTLPEPDGDKALWVKFRDRAGNETTALPVSLTLDRVAPVISGVTAANFTAGGADVSWTTDEPATTRVEYGLTTAYGSFFPAVPGAATETTHDLTLTGLASGAAYHFRVVSSDRAGNAAQSADGTLLTKCAAPATLAVTDRRGKTLYLDLSWTASAGATGYNVYRRDALAGGGFSLIASPASPAYTDTLPNTVPYNYEYYVTAVNGSGESLPSNVVAAVGTDNPPVISNVAAVPDQLTCAITWVTDEPATSQVRYGTSPGSYPYQTTVDPALVTSHSVTLTDLDAATTYYFVVRSVDTTNNATESGEYSFTTTARTAPPAPLNFSVREIGQGNKVVLSWDPAPMADGYRLYSRDLTDPANPGPWILLRDLTGTSYTDGRYGPHTAYTFEYYVVAYNEEGVGPESEHIIYVQEG